MVNTNTQPDNLQRVSRKTRAKKSGKFIYCPKCGAEARVFHFSWSALSCCSCNQMVDKLEWCLENPQIERPDNRLVYSLLFDRKYAGFVHEFNDKCLNTLGHYLDEVDSAGSRSVWVYMPLGKDSYDDAEDLPQWVFDDFVTWIYLRHNMKPNEFSICKRIPDPGLGIVLPEDFELLEKGGLPDGFIRTQ